MGTLKSQEPKMGGGSGRHVMERLYLEAFNVVFMILEIGPKLMSHL
jgi:hypothetical protein